jgi:serine-aspartate repeat-containing protein C/D/E
MFKQLSAVIGVLALSGVASATLIEPGLYRLGNHPDGSARPPYYGLRLDERYNATSGHDTFTFDFEAPTSSVFMTVSATTIVISGQAYGGRDTGDVYENDQYLGLYTFNFTYSLGVAPVPGDDDVWVSTANHANSGSITTPLGDNFNLVDEFMGGYSFRLGNENNDLGHRGFNGISGWGWLTYGPPYNHVADSDWLFTATLVPAPGVVPVGALVVLLGARRRRS